MAEVLFICTGNYYRSRFAETLFAHRAPQRGLAGWRATSAGLRIDVEQRVNVGPMSRDAVDRLRRMGIDPEPYLRMPRALSETDLTAATEIILLDEDEHRPMLTEQFPHWCDRVTWWRIRDLPPTTAYDPLAQIDGLVDDLLRRLR